jgi:hypothetical protein
MVVVGCGQVWSVVPGRGRTENPRVGGSIPPLATPPDRCGFIDFASQRLPGAVAVFRFSDRKRAQKGPRARQISLLPRHQPLEARVAL